MTDNMWTDLNAYPELAGLDESSARDATPRWYGVSIGNGSDGVSQMWPDYYVRTTDPWTLARAATIGAFKPVWQRRVTDELHVDGEAEHTISATLFEPLDQEPEESEANEPEESGYCEANGAYFICEVFLVDVDTLAFVSKPQYESLEECFNVAELALARED